MELGHLLTRSGLMYPEVSSYILLDIYWNIVYSFLPELTFEQTSLLSTNPATAYNSQHLVSSQQIYVISIDQKPMRPSTTVHVFVSWPKCGSCKFTHLVIHIKLTNYTPVILGYLPSFVICQSEAIDTLLPPHTIRRGTFCLPLCTTTATYSQMSKLISPSSAPQP
jgi:hypothetical protein